MTPAAQSWLQLLTALAALGGFFAWQTHYIDRRVDDLRSEMGRRLEDLKADLEDLKADLIARIDALEKRLVERIERLEHPVTRP